MTQRKTAKDAAQQQAKNQLAQYGFTESAEGTPKRIISNNTPKRMAPGRHPYTSNTTTPVPEGSPAYRNKPVEMSATNVRRITERCVISVCEALDREGVLVAAGGYNGVRRLLFDHLFDVNQQHLFVAGDDGKWYPTKVVKDATSTD